MAVDTLPIEMQNVLAKVKRQLESFARENKLREGYDLIDITTRKVRAQKLDISLQKAILRDLTRMQVSFTIAENKRAKQSHCLCWL